MDRRCTFVRYAGGPATDQKNAQVLVSHSRDVVEEKPEDAVKAAKVERHVGVPGGELSSHPI